jgi:hypothetical protein
VTALRELNSDDAENFRQLISELEQMKVDIPTGLLEEGKQRAEKFGT